MAVSLGSGDRRFGAGFEWREVLEHAFLEAKYMYAFGGLDFGFCIG